MPQPIYRLRLVLSRIGDSEEDVLTQGWPVLAELDGEEANIVLNSPLTRSVTRKLWEKQLKGAVEHKFVMQVGDRRVNALVEAQAEALDLLQYLEKALAEVDCCHDLDGCEERVKHDARE